MKPDSAPVITVRPVTDFAAVGRLWRDLESRADGSFFQSWAWTGCLVEERFPEPWLLSAQDTEGRVLALALLNRGRRRLETRPTLFLGETGDAGRDSIFIEHNGLLLDRAGHDQLASACWSALAHAHEAGLARARWVLSGVPHRVAHGLPRDRMATARARRPAPYLDFAKTASDAPVLDQLSANSRQQLRRSLRAWEEIGALTLDVATNFVQAAAFLDHLKALHQRYWTGRGRQGAFAEPFFERFHRALLDRAGPSQSVDLVRVSANDRTVGYLYNLVHQGWIAAYQSGFDFSQDADRLRPGLVCHLLAIEHYRRAGMRFYDFLGGEARYKRGFANAETELLWLEVRHKSPWHFGRRCISMASQES